VVVVFSKGCLRAPRQGNLWRESIPRSKDKFAYAMAFLSSGAGGFGLVGWKSQVRDDMPNCTGKK